MAKPTDIIQVTLAEWDDPSCDYCTVKIGVSLFFRYHNPAYSFLRFYLGRPYTTWEVLRFNRDEWSLTLFDLFIVGLSYGALWGMVGAREVFHIPFAPQEA